MVTEPQITNQPIVLENVCTQCLDPWFVFEMLVSFQHPPVEFDYLAESKVLSRCLIQTAGCLHKLQK